MMLLYAPRGLIPRFGSSFPLVGRNGIDIARKWETEQPQAYSGISVPDMPNYLCFIGPNSPISNGSSGAAYPGNSCVYLQLAG